MMTISHTFLSAYRQCKRRAFLQYVKRVVPPDQIDHRNFMVGSVVDDLFKQWACNKKFESGWMLKYFKEVFYDYLKKHRVILKGPNDETNLLRKTEIAVQRLEDCSDALALDKRKIFYQYKSSFVREGFSFFAILDMFFPDEGLICDLKITQEKKYLDENQLRFYTLVLSRVGKEIKKASFLSPLMSDFYREVDVSLSAMSEFEFDLWPLIKQIQEQNWTADPKTCFWCPVEKFCSGSFDEDFSSVIKKGAGFILEL